MAGLTVKRAELSATLAGLGYAVSDHVPNRLYPPAVVISTGDPYVTESVTFDESEMIAHLSLYLIAGTATNSAATEALDQMIEDVILNLAGWAVTVSAPYMATVNASKFLACRLDLADTFTLQPKDHQ